MNWAVFVVAGLDTVLVPNATAFGAADVLRRVFRLGVRSVRPNAYQ